MKSHVNEALIERRMLNENVKWESRLRKFVDDDVRPGGPVRGNRKVHIFFE